MHAWRMADWSTELIKVICATVMRSLVRSVSLSLYASAIVGCVFFCCCCFCSFLSFHWGRFSPRHIENSNIFIFNTLFCLNTLFNCFAHFYLLYVMRAFYCSKQNVISLGCRRRRRRRRHHCRILTLFLYFAVNTHVFVPQFRITLRAVNGSVSWKTQLVCYVQIMLHIAMHRVLALCACAFEFFSFGSL